MKSYLEFLTESHSMIDVDGELKHRNNSLGNPIHVTDEGIRNFHRWFNGSESIDSQGRPLVLYHGTDQPNIHGFRPISNGTYHGEGTYFTDSKKDVSDNYANRENSLVMQNYVRLKNPVHVGGNDSTWFDHNHIPLIKTELKKEFPYNDYNKVSIITSNHLEKFVRNLAGERKSGEVLNHIYKKLGYDGIVFHSPHKLKGHPAPLKTTHFISFNPSDIKSINNKGKYENGNYGILESTN